MNDQRSRIASLDGLRAISIGLVLISHLVGTRFFFVPVRLGRIFELGELGVRVFFVISGFLITQLLLKELGASGRIKLSRFYFRRTFRIFPPYYVFIGVLIALNFFSVIQLAQGDSIHALTYTSNYAPNRSWNVGHTWSLSVEEQFYLLWPAVLILIGKRRALWAAAALIPLCPIIRLVIWEWVPSMQSGIGAQFETVADSIAAGCLLAGVRDWLNRSRRYQRLQSSKWFLLVPFAVLFANALHDHPRLYFFFGYTAMNLGIAACVDWCVTNHAGRLGRALNSRSMVFVGVMSYSIYLWQQVFLNRYSSSIVTQFPINIVMVCVASFASFYLVERPSLRLRHRLEGKVFRRTEPLAEVAKEAVAPTPEAETALGNAAVGVG
jgi:peptidoglycan/LPS O-acetylase OafA/YrhL